MGGWDGRGRTATLSRERVTRNVLCFKGVLIYYRPKGMGGEIIRV